MSGVLEVVPVGPTASPQKEKEEIHTSMQGGVHTVQGMQVREDGVLMLECITVLSESFPTQENFPPGPSSTPQRAALHSTYRLTTAALSPLNLVQSRIDHHTNTPTSPSSALLRTPGPAYLLEDVKKLSLDEEGGEIEVRRQLFPEQLDSSEVRTATPCGYNLSKHDLESVVGKKTNRIRLRRL